MRIYRECNCDQITEVAKVQTLFSLVEVQILTILKKVKVEVRNKLFQRYSL